jgi:hypothetical protein
MCVPPLIGVEATHQIPRASRGYAQCADSRGMSTVWTSFWRGAPGTGRKNKIGARLSV